LNQTRPELNSDYSDGLLAMADTASSDP
jgi:hypothetical protein